MTENHLTRIAAVRMTKNTGSYRSPSALSGKVRMRLSTILFLFIPIDAFACMISPSHSSTLTYGVIKILIGLLILFFSFRLHFGSNTIFQSLFYLLFAMVIIGSIYSVVFRYGLYSDPACGTEYGRQTGAFFLLCLIISLLATFTSFIKKHKVNRK